MANGVIVPLVRQIDKGRVTVPQSTTNPQTYHVDFNFTFDAIPTVCLTLADNANVFGYMGIMSVNNVTTTGFDIIVQRPNASYSWYVNYIAMG